MIQNEFINPQPPSETPSSLASKPRMACFGLLGMDVQARQERVGRTYEIARRPSKPEAHTVYIRGIKDDLLAQITREDASLLISDKSESLNADRLALSSGILKSISICKDKSVGCGQYIKNASKFYLNKYVVDGLYHITEDRGLKTEDRVVTIASFFPFCKDKSVDCGQYVKNASKFYLNKYIVDGIFHPKYKNLRIIVGWGIVLGLLYWVLRTEDRRLRTDGINLIYRYSSPILITSVLFTFTSGCGIFTTGSGQGDAPWLLLGSGINANTPSVRDDGMVVSGGGGGIPFTVPVTGMYFVHSDHLGSVSFLTNGRGAIVAGGEFGGKSDIHYKPYGEIDRPHSSGPDISKYKYTGQEEDKESGLLYYKARYYDPGLGRFLQADDVGITDEPFGVNRYMYVGGDPVALADSNGNVCTANIVGAIAFNLMGPVGTAAFGVSGNHTGGGSCSKLPDEKGVIRLLGFLRSDQIENETERSIFLYMVDHYAESLNGVGPSPIGKLNRTELKVFLLFDYLQTGQPIERYIVAYNFMTNGVLRARSSVDQASIYHDQYGPNVFRPQNRRANSKWMGQAKTAAFSHDTWSRNYKREWNATKRSCRDARDLCATVNTIGTTIGDAVMAITGSILFSIANTITGVGTIPKARYNIRGARFKGSPFSSGHSI